MLKPIHPIAKPNPKFGIGMLGKQSGINRSHALLGCIAKKNGIQSTADCHANGCLWFGTVHTCSVVAPVGGRAIGIDEGEFEKPGTIEGFTIYGYLTGIIKNRRNRRGVQ